MTELAGVLDSGQVGRVDLLASDFFRKHDKAIFAQLLLEMGRRGQRAAAARSHCKVVTMAMADGRRYAIEGSANLRSNANMEQFTMTQDASLHDWHSAWIDDLIDKYEVHES